MTLKPALIEEWFERFSPAALRLQRALDLVVGKTFDGPFRAVDIERTFELNRTFASRLNRALSASSPEQMATLLPGRPTMMRIVERATDVCPSEEAVAELSEAYYAYLREVGRMASNQQELSSVLNSHDPQSRREASLRQRAALYRAASDLIGGSVDVCSTIHMSWPNADDPSFADSAKLVAYCGLRRFGMLDAVVIPSGASEDAHVENRLLSTRLDGRPFDSDDAGMIVRELSSDGLPAIRTVSTNSVAYATCVGAEIPQGKPLDFVAAMRHDRWDRNVRAGERGSERFILKPNIPAKLRVSDFLIHKDVWPGIEPQLKVYRDTDLPVSVNNAAGESLLSEVENDDDLEPTPVFELLQPLRKAPKHATLVQYFCEHAKVDIDQFRAFRQVTRYPAIGQSTWIIFRRDKTVG